MKRVTKTFSLQPAVFQCTLPCDSSAFSQSVEYRLTGLGILDGSSNGANDINRTGQAIGHHWEIS